MFINSHILLFHVLEDSRGTKDVSKIAKSAYKSIVDLLCILGQHLFYKCHLDR